MNVISPFTLLKALIPGSGFIEGAGLLFKWLVGTTTGRIVSVVVVVSLAFFFYGIAKKSEGIRETKAAIEKQNREAVDAANKARTDWRLCTDRGGVWSYTKSICDKR